MENIILEIALHTDYDTTITLLKLYPHIFVQYGNIWLDLHTDPTLNSFQLFQKLKCQKHYPNIEYFDNWTGAENYLKCVKQWFLVTFYKFNYKGESDMYYVYEYDEMLREFYDKRYRACKDEDIVWYEFYLEKRYIIIVTSDKYETWEMWYIDHPDEISNKINYFCDDYKQMLSKPNTVINVIDLNKMISWFLGKKRRKAGNIKPTEYLTYYQYKNGELVKLI